MTPLPPGAVIGMLGGGQLGRMAAMAAARLGYRVHVYAPEPDSPAMQLAAAHTVAAYEDAAALAAFAAAVDVVTFEFENVPAAALDALEGRVPCRPGVAALRIGQDRVAEKRFLESAGLAVAPWREVRSAGEAEAALAALGTPCVLKTTRLGYDGRGQAVVRTPGEARAAFARLAPKPLVAEGFIRFAAEISAIAARGADSALALYDPAENRHEHHILAVSRVPARQPPELLRAAQDGAAAVAESLGLVGVVAVEYFVTEDGGLIANEIAPRPHNSGHWTIEACPASQFEQQVRAAALLPLGDPRRRFDAEMRNLIGPEGRAAWETLAADPEVALHWYGKPEARPGRKLGHATWLRPLGGG
jgi:5-(carboxyamino)imidazole ribonucleotide synthase